MNRKTDLKTFTPSMSMGKNVKDTKMLKGEASKDSLTGKNVIKPHVPKSTPHGKLGGMGH